MRLPPFRTLVFWPHLIAGVGAGVVILIMSVTGVLLTYERQMISWSDRAIRSTPPAPGTAHLRPSELLERTGGVETDGAIAITISSWSDAPVTVGAGGRSLLVDAYSGAVLGESALSVRALMSELRALHRWLAIEGEGRPVARAITGWANLIFLFIVASGAYLWLPRDWSWTRLRPVVWFRRGLGGKARDFNWHNTIGLWSALPLLVVVFCALPISFPWFSALVYRVAGDTPPGAAPPPRAADAPDRSASDVAATDGTDPLRGLDDAWALAEGRVPGWTTISLRLPAGGDATSYTFAIDRGNGGQPQLRSTLVVDAASGAVASYEAFGDQTRGRRVRSLMRFAHTGEVWGLLGQTLMGLASLGGVFLVYTGLALALRRLRAWLGRRGGAAPAGVVREAGSGAPALSDTPGSERAAPRRPRAARSTAR